jgi:hypothetical protein
MDHWRNVLPPGVMLEVHYEDVTGNLEVEGRRMVAHCGLEWEDRCLSYHETERPVRTASAIQVRQPIYLSSIGRWRHHARQLGPLIEALRFDLADSPSTKAIEPGGTGHHCDPTNTLGNRGNSNEA